jgi:L-lactate dehydrogenase complex protein LldE
MILALGGVEGLQLIEIPDAETCCGFGGTFSVKYPDISVAMGQQKVEQAIQLGADCLISTDLSCLMHLQGYVQKNGLSLKTMHLADVLTSGW